MKTPTLELILRNFKNFNARATRDAYFLTNFPYTTLPAMVMATSVLGVALAFARSYCNQCSW